jgi:hypothetical protein
MKLNFTIDQRKSTCGLCSSKNVNLTKNVGSDIDTSGEEIQHLETCADCGATRLVCERWVDFIDYKIYESKWWEKDGFNWYGY